MLTFEEKLAVITTFPELQKKDVSMGRVNFHYEASIVDKKIVVYHLHPNGNGFVYAEQIPHTATDDKGFVNIREFTADELRSIIQASIQSLSNPAIPLMVSSPAFPELSQETILSSESWEDGEGQTLTLVEEDELWNVYTGSNLEMAFETYTEAKKYLKDEGFWRS
ncbi:hypothetical protein EHS13_34170 [Paenibacillus psychroresistens]|uniref:Uncharacterized protein n=1 Tax=Paenibacillus psychroresistens TaxID=1778678 RepID=A0A6B8RSW7_9BACL|nr:hypothetical protein [Paenibacillus psychroresistens]QGQ99551.1 hypothetical protein EHS13_34170 [Paenibacillus psychroresistens]